MPEANHKTIALLQFRAADALDKLPPDRALEVVQQWAEDNAIVLDLLTLWEKGK